MKLITLNIDFSRFSVRDLVVLTGLVTMVMGMATVCGVCALVVIAGAFRPIRPETAEHVYQLLSTIMGLVGGLIGGAAGGYIAGKGENEPQLKGATP